MAKGSKRTLGLTSLLFLALSSTIYNISPVMANDTSEFDNPTGAKVIDGVRCLSPSLPHQKYDTTKWPTVSSYTQPEITPGFYTPPGTLDADVAALLNQLTIEEKVGQMMQIEIGQFIGCDGNLNKTAVKTWLDDWKLGSILETPGNHGGKYAWYTPPRLADMIDQIQEIATQHGSKIPLLYGVDQVHGGNYVKGNTVFPQSIGMAATFNPDLVREGGKITAKDSRASGIPWVFAPILDLGVNKNWPRIYEGYGEDPLLGSRMAKASINGLQGNYRKDRNRVAASIKHFIAYGVPLNGLDLGSRMVPDNTLMEYYVPAFDAAIKAGAATIMHSYSVLNQEAVVTSEYYLKELLREKLKFKGMMVTDWGEINKVVTEHFTAGSIKQAVHQTMEYTTIDLSMIADDHEFGKELLALYREGKVSKARIDESVGRLLQLKKDLGLLENPKVDRSLLHTVGSKQDREAAIESGRQSLTLLKNENSVLPLKPEDKVLVVGPTADSIRYLSGGWSVHWQGPSDAEGDKVYDGLGTSILSGMEQIIGSKPNFLNVTDIDGNYTKADMDNVIKAAKNVDKVVICLGEKTYAEVVGNIDHLDLPQGQIDLVNAISKNTKAKTAVVLVEGRPRSLQNIPEIADSVMLAYLPGPWGGVSIAEALYGKFSPSGRLPYTYPRFDRQAPLTYWMPLQDSYDPQWAFGTGIGYSKITYSDFQLSTHAATVGDNIKATVKVTNHGPYDQLEPVLLYTSQHFRPLYSPDRWRLREFTKVDLKAGETKTVELKLDTNDLGFWARGRSEPRYVHTSAPFNVTLNANSLSGNSVVATFNLTAPNSPFI